MNWKATLITPLPKLNHYPRNWQKVKVGILVAKSRSFIYSE